MARLHPWGLVFAAIFFTLGLTPSLLLRDWFYQGVVSGLAAGCGYGVGVAVHWLVVRIARWRPIVIPQRRRTIIDAVVAAIVVVWMIITTVLSINWQGELAELTGADIQPTVLILAITPVGVVMALLVVGLGRAIRRGAQWVGRLFPDSAHHRLRMGVSWVAVLLVVVWAVETAIPGTLVAAGEKIFEPRNANPEQGRVQPAQPERSGSPDSLVEWEDVGAYGSRFLNEGASAAELEEVTEQPAVEPIRLYAGLATAPTDRDRAEVIIDELERTNAVEREAILLIMTTGTGWVNPATAQAFELLYGGDTAVISEQYSAVPSAYHFLAGGEVVQTAGRDFITPIVDWWNTLDEDSRPKLYLYGESLGSTGVESAFSGMRDIMNSVDGIFLAGPPNFNPLWSVFTERRDPDTREVQPEYSGGMVVRFANRNEDILRYLDDGDEWGPTRMLYVQHPSDPVTWWSPELIAREPDWLIEEPGYDRLPAMRWVPIVTFLQLSADLPVSQNVLDGHGHNYGDSMVPGFAAVAKPGRFDRADIERVQSQMEQARALGG